MPVRYHTELLPSCHAERSISEVELRSSARHSLAVCWTGSEKPFAIMRTLYPHKKLNTIPFFVYTMNKRRTKCQKTIINKNAHAIARAVV